MSDTNAAPPAKEDYAAVDKPLWQSKTLWSVVVAVVLGLPALLEKLQAIPGFNLPDYVSTVMLVLSVIATWLAPYFARSGAQEMAARVHRQMRLQK